MLYYKQFDLIYSPRACREVGLYFISIIIQYFLFYFFPLPPTFYLILTTLYFFYFLPISILSFCPSSSGWSKAKNLVLFFTFYLLLSTFYFFSSFLLFLLFTCYFLLFYYFKFFCPIIFTTTSHILSCISLIESNFPSGTHSIKIKSFGNIFAIPIYVFSARKRCLISRS